MKLEDVPVILVSPLLDGLRPIPSQVAIDTLVVVWMGLTVFSTSRRLSHLVWLLAAVGVMFGSSGLTGRWSISLPLIPFTLIQLLRRLAPVQRSKSFLRGTIGFVSLLLIVTAVVLSILFPAIELPPLKGTYNVGVVEFHLPVDFSSGDAKTCTSHSELPVKIYYPTLDAPGRTPMLNKHTARDYCDAIMLFGAPPFLKDKGWMLHNWLLTTTEARTNATLLDTEIPFPLVVFSHGLGGNADIYSYQTMALASEGYVVLVISHQDRSAPAIMLSNGTKVHYDFELMKVKEPDYSYARRNGAEIRVSEFIAATEAFHRMNGKDIEGLNLSLRGRLSTVDTTFMGHSFGGATALTAASRRPDLVRVIVAHEPATNWMPDDARHTLFHSEKLQGLDHNWDGGTGGFSMVSLADPNLTLHTKDMMILFSHEWRQKGWASSPTLEMMHAHGRLGPEGGVSLVKTIDKISHNEFSDTSMLTCLWLARNSKFTGPRNPLDTALEIRVTTKTFLDAARSRLK